MKNKGFGPFENGHIDVSKRRGKEVQNELILIVIPDRTTINYVIDTEVRVGSYTKES